MNCPIEEMFTLKECRKCGGQAIWKVSMYAGACREQCTGCGELIERAGAIEYPSAPRYAAPGDAADRMKELKREHEGVRVYIARVEECIRDGERVLNSPGDEYVGRLRQQAFTLFYTLAYLGEAAARHEEKEEELLRRWLKPDLVEFMAGRHGEIRAGIAKATEVIGKVLPGPVDRNNLQEFCVSIRRILEPLFAQWRGHLAVTDSILDTLSVGLSRTGQPA